MLRHLITLAAASAALLAGCDSAPGATGAPAMPGTPATPETPASPPESPPPPAGLPAHLAFTSGLHYVSPTSPDEVVAAPGCFFVGDEAMNPPSYRLETGDLATDGAAFTLTLTGRAYPYDTTPESTRTIRGTLVQSGPVLRLTSGSHALVATVGPTVQNPTTVHLQGSPFLQGNSANCSVYRFTSGTSVAGVAGAGTETASYTALSADGRAFPYYHSSFSNTAVYHDGLTLQLRPAGTYEATLTYHYNSESARTETATGRYISAGDAIVLDPSRATQTISGTEDGALVLSGNGLRFSSSTFWTGGTLRLTRQ